MVQHKEFTAPTIEQIAEYAKERGYSELDRGILLGVPRATRLADRRALHAKLESRSSYVAQNGAAI